MRRTGNIGNRGQSLVEFALVVPLLILLVIGIAEFGRAWMTRNVMTGAAREGARRAAVATGSGSTDNTWQSRVQTVLSSAGLSGPAPQLADNGDSVTVTVFCTFTPVVAGFVPGLSGPIQLSSSTTMRKEY